MLFVVVAAAGCSKVIDPDKVSDSIKEDLLAKKVVIKSVDCPSGKTAKQGDKFQCTVTTDHQTLTIDVDQVDNDGSIKWELQGRIYNERALGDKLEAQAGGGVDIQCGDQVTIMKKGDAIHCVTKHPDGKITLTAKNDDGDIDIKEE
jgi:hypothetical protein